MDITHEVSRDICAMRLLGRFDPLPLRKACPSLYSLMSLSQVFNMSDSFLCNARTLIRMMSYHGSKPPPVGTNPFHAGPMCEGV